MIQKKIQKNGICTASVAAGHRYFFPVLCAVLYACIFSAGCTARAALCINADNSAVLEFKTRGGKTLEDTAAAFAGDSGTTVVLDEKAIRNTFEAAGFTLTELKLAGKTGIELKAHLSDIYKSAAADMLKTETVGKEEKLTLTFSPAYMQTLTGLLPQETAEYTEFLMAPLFTGERMTADEYAELIGSMYGKAMRNDLKTAFFNFDVSLSSAVARAEIFPSDAGVVRIDGEKAEFQLLLNKFLSNSDKIKICIWRKI